MPRGVVQVFYRVGNAMPSSCQIMISDPEMAPVCKETYMQLAERARICAEHTAECPEGAGRDPPLHHSPSSSEMSHWHQALLP